MFPESFVRTNLSQDADESMRMERMATGTCEEAHSTQLDSLVPVKKPRHHPSGLQLLCAAAELHRNTSWPNTNIPSSFNSYSSSPPPPEQYVQGVSTTSQQPASDQPSLAPTKLDTPKRKRPKKTPKIKGWKNTEYCWNGDGKALTRFISCSEAAGTSS